MVKTVSIFPENGRLVYIVKIIKEIAKYAIEGEARTGRYCDSTAV